MIEITYTKSKDEFVLDMTGHAGSNEPGKDLVCCAVSTLFFTLANRIGGISDEHSVLYKSGEGHIDAHGKDTLEPFETILTGLTTLSEQYPEYITIKGDIC